MKNLLCALRSAICLVAISQPFIAMQAQTDPAIPAGDIRIHYHRTDGDYTGWTVYAYDDTTEDTGSYGSGPVTVSGTDSYGAYFDVGITSGAQEVGLILHDPTAAAGDVKDPGPNEFVDPTTEGLEYWAYTGIGKLYTAAPSLTNPTALLPGYARIHYYRPDGNYTNWTVYAYGDTAEYTGDYNSGLQGVTGIDSYGAYFDIQLIANAKTLGFIVHNTATGTKDPGPDMSLAVNTITQAWVISGDATTFTSVPSATQIAQALLNVQQAYWLDRQRVAIPSAQAQAGATYSLVSALNGGLTVGSSGLLGSSVVIPLTLGGALTADELLRYPQLSSYTVLQLNPNTPLATLQSALRGEMALGEVLTSGTLGYATGVQAAGVLDDLYYYAGRLGVVFREDGRKWEDWPDDNDCDVKLKLWAPTAQNVALLIYDKPEDTAPSSTVPMHYHDGVWVATGHRGWTGKYYLYQVKVWVPADGAVDTNLTSDPYSIDLAVNGAMSRITDLSAETTKPSGWEFDRSPPLESLNDLSIYELHIRDFSINDPTVPVALRGTYDAFGDLHTAGMEHLHTLAESGLRAVHILPSFHFASVNEDKSKWIIPQDLAQYPPAGEEQQAAVAASQTSPAYNWGYDPVHYLAPAGQYAENPYDRVREYRVMVSGLHRAGLRVIQDVVFNHTSASGEGPNSNLDEVVPGYYHRLDTNGALETASCCADTASEHRMMEKLMSDTLVLNAREYKIDGFRFDEMYQHFTYNMSDILADLRALTPEHDGVDGSKLYIYGEGFNAGGTANNVIGPAASQLNLFGFGIGTFNDRIRDGDKGPLFDEQAQGFATGLFTDTSAYMNQVPPTGGAKSALLSYSDWIRIGLTGNLRDYTFLTAAGTEQSGSQISYNGVPAGYTASPIEAINYASVHDNQDLFDSVQLRSNLQDTIFMRARRQVLGMAVIALGQGVPFFMAGDDLLRSKDMDTNSYNSGDWFNKIDWIGRSANWGIGLPIASQNQAEWPAMTPLLNSTTYAPQPAQIKYAGEAFQELLRIRYSSELFRMTTAAEIQNNLTFLNTGPAQVPGLIVMKLDSKGRQGNGQFKHIVIVFNAAVTPTTYKDEALEGLDLHLHPIQRESADPATRLSTYDAKEGSFTVPALTTAVFVQ